MAKLPVCAFLLAFEVDFRLGSSASRALLFVESGRHADGVGVRLEERSLSQIVSAVRLTPETRNKFPGLTAGGLDLLEAYHCSKA